MYSSIGGVGPLMQEVPGSIPSVGGQKSGGGIVQRPFIYIYIYIYMGVYLGPRLQRALGGGAPGGVDGPAAAPHGAFFLYICLIIL